ncbi:MAG: hypothetical protein J5958_00285 [Clostridia bacterium]|nr:hypothetical protein [Clostridia bacterium]
MKTVNASVFRRTAALLLALLLLIPLTAYFPAPAASPSAETAEVEVPALQSGGSGSGLISESEEYQYLLSEYLKCSTRISVKTDKFNLTQERVHELFSVLYYSEAELFYTDRGYSLVTENGEFVAILPSYLYTASEIPGMRDEFHEKTDEILAQADPSWSEWEKIAFVHDYIALHYSYDYSLSIYDAYQLVTKETGVCQAYSLLARYLLKKLGVECECVSCDDLRHEWNIVKIGGSWYHMDVTWDDWDDKGLYGQVSHAYFLSSDSFFDAGGHHSDGGWSSPVRATNGKYDDVFSDVSTPFIFAPEAIYAINGNTLVSYDPATEEFETLRELNLAWSVSHGPFGIGGGTWKGIYAGLVYINGKLYWNGNKKIYSFDPVTREDPLVIYTYTPSSPRDKKLIFGFRAETDDRTIRFTLSLMSDPNSGEITETVYTAGGYVITWMIAGKEYQSVCLRGETPHCNETLLAIPSDLFDYTFLQWEGYTTLPAATKDATYTALFRMDRNDVDAEGGTLRDQYYLLRAARRMIPYAGSGYSGAEDRVAELNVLLAAFAGRVAAVNTAFSGTLFGDD